MLLRMAIESLLIEYLADRDMACPGCGYNLRGLKEPRCPECGADLQLRVSLAEPKLGVFIAILVALSTGFGFNLFLLGWGMWAMSFRGFPGLRDLWSVACFSAFLGAAVVVLLRNRRWLREREPLAQAALIAISVLLSIGSVFVFFSIVN